MPTPGERRALLFLGAVAVLGAGWRGVGAVRGGGGGGGEDPAAQPLLERQRLAAEREGARAREERARRAEREAAREARKKTGEGRKAAARAPKPSPAPAAPLAPVDVDQADTIALAGLPGVGPALARRIVADRAARGAFGGIEALDAVPGVGPRLLARLAPHVTFSGPRRPRTGDQPGPRGASDRRRASPGASRRRAGP